MREKQTLTDEEKQRIEEEEREREQARRKIKKEEEENTNSLYSRSEYAKYIILGLLLPIVGIIVGIVFMMKSDKQARKMGETILCWSIIFMILLGVLFSSFL